MQSWPELEEYSDADVAHETERVAGHLVHAQIRN